MDSVPHHKGIREPAPVAPRRTTAARPAARAPKRPNAARGSNLRRRCAVPRAKKSAAFSESLTLGVEPHSDHARRPCATIFSARSAVSVRSLNLPSSARPKATARSRTSSPPSGSNFSGCDTSARRRQSPPRSKNTARATTSSGWSHGFVVRPRDRHTRPRLPSSLSDSQKSEKCPRKRRTLQGPQSLKVRKRLLSGGSG